MNNSDLSEGGTSNQVRLKGATSDTEQSHKPLKVASFSISTLSVTTKRLLRCLRGGFPTIGMVSRGVERSRLSVLARGGVTLPSNANGMRSGDPY